MPLERERGAVHTSTQLSSHKALGRSRTHHRVFGRLRGASWTARAQGSDQVGRTACPLPVHRLFEEYKSEHPGFANKRLYFDGEDVGEGEEAQLEEMKERRRLEQFHVFPSRF